MQNPKHIAIIMDGNGRWAERRKLPRVAGHQQGVESLRTIVNACCKKNIEQLTLFAFSSENWLRPESEVNFLLSLALKLFQKKEMQALSKNNVQVRIIGDRAPFSLELKTAMREAEQQTAQNTGLKVNIALNYGGQWDIVQAARKLCEKVAAKEMTPNEVTEKTFQNMLSLSRVNAHEHSKDHSNASPPDLLIRSSGEQRISNFLLWDIAYSELYFTETLWPDFREAELEAAIEAYHNRKRRFGNIEENASVSEPVKVLKSSHSIHSTHTGKNHGTSVDESETTECCVSA